MNISLLTYSWFLAGMALLFVSCKYDSDQDYRDYPVEVGEIIVSRCATSGCHNDASYVAAGGLNLTLWETLFEGSRGGSPVIPFRPDQSFLMFFVNTNPDEGVVLTPTMPFNGTPLNADEYATLRDWIADGAPNADGKIKFADDPLRRKVYVTNQGCDLMAVFDAETGILMRYIDVGSEGAIESPHQVKTSPDGKYWYTIFFSGTVLQKYDAVDDSFVSEVVLGTGSWNTFRLSTDGKFAFVIDWSASGAIAVVDLEHMQLLETYSGSGVFEWPHGSMLNPTDDVLYVTAQHGNFIYKIDISDVAQPQIEKISLNASSPTTISWLDPHELEMAPDGSKYFVTCQESNEVRVMQTSNDSLLVVIPTGTFPQEMAVSHELPYLFVTCTEDVVSFPGKIGSVHVIDYTTNTLVKTIHTGFQPHGITVDDQMSRVYVAHRNINSSGPPPHHSTDCAGRNGYVTMIEMSTLELVPGYKVEVSVDPYSVALRK